VTLAETKRDLLNSPLLTTKKASFRNFIAKERKKLNRYPKHTNYYGESARTPKVMKLYETCVKHNCWKMSDKRILDCFMEIMSHGMNRTLNSSGNCCWYEKFKDIKDIRLKKLISKHMNISDDDYCIFGTTHFNKKNDMWMNMFDYVFFQYEKRVICVGKIKEEKIDERLFNEIHYFERRFSWW